MSSREKGRSAQADLQPGSARWGRKENAPAGRRIPWGWPSLTRRPGMKNPTADRRTADRRVGGRRGMDVLTADLTPRERRLDERADLPPRAPEHGDQLSAA